MTLLQAYTYAVLRYVPRIERGEFHNLAVVLYSQHHQFLDVVPAEAWQRLATCDPGFDAARVEAALNAVRWVCQGDARAGLAAEQPLGTRFGFLVAPRSTVIQPGPVHSGRTRDPAAELRRLVRTVC